MGSGCRAQGFGIFAFEISRVEGLELDPEKQPDFVTLCVVAVHGLFLRVHTLHPNPKP